jgi:phage recombination protein Bet
MSNLPQKSFDLKPEDIKTLTQAGIIPNGTPAPQVSIFAAVCRELQLSPYSREIYLLPIGGKFCPIVGINGLRRIAAKSGQFAGVDDVKYDVQPDGSYQTAAALIKEKKLPETATCTVYRIIAGMRVPFTATVAFREFDKKGGNWQSMPWQMIAKVAEAFAIRKGFSDYGTAGVFIEEEEHAIEVTAAGQNEHMENLRKQAEYYLEQATAMPDEAEKAARLYLSNAQTPAELQIAIERIKQYLPPSNDPRQQFKERAA